MKRKLILVLALLLALTVFIVPGNMMLAEDTEEVTLRVAWWGNQKRNDTTEAMLKYFMEQNPSIKVESEFLDWSGYWDRLATQAAGSNLPDVIQQDNQYIGQYHSRDLLVNLDPFIEEGKLDVSNVSDSVLQTGMFDGSLFALCSGLNAMTMIINPEYASEADVEVPMRFSYEDIFEMSQKIYDATGKTAYLPAGNGNIQMMARDVGEQLFADDAPELGVSKETLTRYFQYQKDFVDSEWAVSLDQLQHEVTAGVENTSIATGDSWNYFPGGSNQLDAIEGASGLSLELRMFPQIPDAPSESMYLRPSMFFSVTTQSELQDEAVMMIDMFTNDETAQDHLLAERGVPVSNKMREYLAPKVSDVQKKIFEYISEVEEVAVPFDPPYPAGSTEVMTLVDDYTSLVRYGEMTPEEAAEMLIMESNAALERAQR